MTDQQARAALKPCPFCGNAELELDDSKVFGGKYISCDGCETMVLAPPETDRAGQVAAWNRRASVPAPEPATDIREVVFRALDSAVEGPARSIDTHAFFDALREKGLCVAPIAEPATDEDNDDIDEAMSDAISDGDGWLYARYVRHHLAKHGLELVRKVTT